MTDSKFSFGKTSIAKLDTANFRLREIMRDALATGIMDFAITEGYRNEETQNRYYAAGKSKVKYPDSKHNKMPSDAVDVVPFINGAPSWDKLHCCVLAGVILACASKIGIKIRWGGCWSGNFEDVGKQKLNDYVHFEEV